MYVSGFCVEYQLSPISRRNDPLTQLHAIIRFAINYLSMFFSAALERYSAEPVQHTAAEGAFV